jgi:predicted sulfurtransferase
MFKVVSFYEYQPALCKEYLEVLRHQLREQFERWFIRGRIYISPEGINAHVALPQEHIKPLAVFMREKTPFSKLHFYTSHQFINETSSAFPDLRIRLRRQLVADDLTYLNVSNLPQPTYLSPLSFHQHLETQVDQKESILVDIRNHYER